MLRPIDQETTAIEKDSLLLMVSELRAVASYAGRHREALALVRRRWRVAEGCSKSLHFTVVSGGRGV